MTARDTIADVQAKHEPVWQTDGDYGSLNWVECACGEWEESDAADNHYRHQAEAVIAAVRAMPVDDQAELIGGITQTDAAGTVARVVGLWQETPQ